MGLVELTSLLPVQPALKERHREGCSSAATRRLAGDVGMALSPCCPPDSDKQCLLG